MTIYQTINAFCFMVSCGFAIAGTARVGNLLGAGNPGGAALAGWVSVGLCALGSGTLGLILYALPHDFLPGLFLSSSLDEEHEAVIDQVAAVIPLLAVYVFADGIQSGINGIITGCGRQWIVMPIVIIAYWVVGVPLAYYLGIHRNGGDDTVCLVHRNDGDIDTAGDHYYYYDDDSIYDTDRDRIVLCGDVGLVAGMTVGTWVHMLLLAAVVIGATDWKVEAEKARKRVAIAANGSSRQFDSDLEVKEDGVVE